MKSLIKAWRASCQRGLPQQRLAERTHRRELADASITPLGCCYCLPWVVRGLPPAEITILSGPASQPASSSTGPFPPALIKFALKTIRFEFVALVFSTWRSLLLLSVLWFDRPAVRWWKGSPVPCYATEIWHATSAEVMCAGTWTEASLSFLLDFTSPSFLFSLFERAGIRTILPEYLFHKASFHV